MYKCRQCGNLESTKESTCPKCGSKDSYIALNNRFKSSAPPMEYPEEEDVEEEIELD